MKHFPNFITSLNLASGFIAIIFAANGNLVTASWLILAAMIFDFLDGLSARLFKAYSAIGKELDSLADIVSFGVAPGIILYRLLNESISLNGPIDMNSDSMKAMLLMLIPAIMPVCGAIRLAIFNIDSTQAKTFKGLPIPANALAVISIVIAGHYSQSQLINSLTRSPFLLIVFTIILSLLMVSRMPLLSLKVSNFKFKGNEGRYILAGLVLIFFAIFGVMAFPLIIPLYIISSAISLLF
ncbi:MAG: CDP-diacylglycerol--serine O-phosphatidyltransferase [Bacteroidales bacterium]|jgi:CDP-diacylglycerol--serine O-phosphatidyltransferase